MKSSSQSIETLRRAALAYPVVVEGVVCEKAAFQAGKKSFLFVGIYDDSWNVMLKLGDSLPEAKKLAAAWPDCYKVGGTGWVTVTFHHGQIPPPGLLERWMGESYRLLVPQKLVAQLSARGASPTRVQAAKKKPLPKKSAKKARH